MLLLLSLAWAVDVPVTTAAELEAALSTASGDTLLLGAGTYVLPELAPIGADVTLRPAYGGGPVRIETSAEVVFSIEDGASVVIQDLTFDGGSQAALADVTDGSLTVRRLQVQNTAGTNGGAVRVGTDGQLVVEASRFATSAADRGGFVHVLGQALFTNTVFEGGTASQSGGALYAEGDGVLRITGGTFLDNVATLNGGDIAVFAGASLSVVGASLTRGQAGNGGSIASQGVTDLLGTTIRLAEAGDGGAILAQGAAALTVRRSVVSHNTAAYEGGAIDCDGSASCWVADSTLTNNTANRGGAIHARATALTVERSLVCNNTVSFRGGGIDAQALLPGSRLLTNAFLFDVADGFGGALAVDGLAGELLVDSTLFHANTASQGSVLTSPTEPTSADVRIARSAFVQHPNPSISDGAVVLEGNLRWDSPMAVGVVDATGLQTDPALDVVGCTWEALVPTSSASPLHPLSTAPQRYGPLIARPDEGFTDDDGDAWVQVVDCNDLSAEVNPARVEVPDNGEDDDCDGIVDEGGEADTDTDTDADTDTDTDADTDSDADADVDIDVPRVTYAPPGFACSTGPVGVSWLDWLRRR